MKLDKISILKFTFKTKFSRYSCYSMTFFEISYFIQMSKLETFTIFSFEFGSYRRKFSFIVLNKHFSFFELPKDVLKKIHLQNALSDCFDE